MTPCGAGSAFCDVATPVFRADAVGTTVPTTKPLSADCDAHGLAPPPLGMLQIPDHRRRSTVSSPHAQHRACGRRRTTRSCCGAVRPDQPPDPGRDATRPKKFEISAQRSRPRRGCGAAGVLAVLGAGHTGGGGESRRCPWCSRSGWRLWWSRSSCSPPQASPPWSASRSSGRANPRGNRRSASWDFETIKESRHVAR